ncbi:hypothetical protein HBNXHx_1739 [Haloferax volcanii]|nr:hypothetical protein HBNXHx_1739 [Haloferax alexandrinus]
MIAPAPADSGGVFEGFWGLITEVSDGNKLDDYLTLDISLVYLADASEYADRSAVEAALSKSPV